MRPSMKNFPVTLSGEASAAKCRLLSQQAFDREMIYVSRQPASTHLSPEQCGIKENLIASGL